jgi:caa(3)-type oxidase subunit IV
MAEAHATTHGYRGYWAAWLVLLVLTLGMTTIRSRGILLTGIGIKSLVIVAWFMHLKSENRWLVWTVAAGIGFALFLFFLIQFDAHPS